MPKFISQLSISTGFWLTYEFLVMKEDLEKNGCQIFKKSNFSINSSTHEDYKAAQSIVNNRKNAAYQKFFASKEGKRNYSEMIAEIN